MNQYYVYILTNKRNGVLYIGVTNDLERRMYEHKLGAVDGFSKKYCLKRLIYYEEFNKVDDAIEREKQLKNWKRDWKIELVEKSNSSWADLADDIL